MFEQRTVVSLVYKEACFLSAEPVDAETETVFSSDIVFGRSDDILVLRVEMSLIGQGGLGFVIYIMYVEAGKLHETTGDDVAREVHAG